MYYGYTMVYCCCCDYRIMVILFYIMLYYIILFYEFYTFVSFGYIRLCVIRLSFTHIPVKAPSCGWAARAAETPSPPRPPNSGRAIAGDSRPKAGWAMSGYALGTEVTELTLKGWSLLIIPNRGPAPSNTHKTITHLALGNHTNQNIFKS